MQKDKQKGRGKRGALRHKQQEKQKTIPKTEHEIDHFEDSNISNYALTRDRVRTTTGNILEPWQKHCTWMQIPSPYIKQGVFHFRPLSVIYSAVVVGKEPQYVTIETFQSLNNFLYQGKQSSLHFVFCQIIFQHQYTHTKSRLFRETSYITNSCTGTLQTF